LLLHDFCGGIWFEAKIANSSQPIQQIMTKNLIKAGLMCVVITAMASCGRNAAKATDDSDKATEVTEKRADNSGLLINVETVELKDYGNAPTVLDIDDYTLSNDNFRTVLWTGGNLQVTLMSIPVGGDVGLEQHNHIDQFLRIEEGQGRVMMGDTKENLDFVREAEADYAIMVPAGKWHNIVNTGDKPLKIYSIYAPIEHPHGTIHKTQADSDAAHHE
jgi:mannose-6-phosphate isomerase-like protein (cupin superfamily)